jgi:hypothetical protein
MSVKDDFLVDLEEEVLTEAAQNLFSRRRQLEREIDAFLGTAAEVRKQMDKTLAVAGSLHEVVIEPERFYEALGVEPKDLLKEKKSTKALALLAVPFRFTVKGRYTALVEALYAELAAEAEKYNHGEVYRDRETALMKRTPNYEGMLQWHAELNNHIATENKNRPSYSLHLAKALNAELCKKEKALDACTGGTNGCDLDKKLAFKDVPFSSTGLVQIPVLPPLTEIKKSLHGFLEEVCNRHRERVHQLVSQKGLPPHTPGAANH